MKFGLIDILKLGGFDDNLTTKIVRHQSKEFRLPELRRQNRFELYQSYQSKPVFHSVLQIVSFYAIKGTHARFYGVYRVDGWQTPFTRKLPRFSEVVDVTHDNAKFLYKLVPDDRFRSLRGRLSIDWGNSTLAWHQKLTNKPVIELLAEGRKLDEFTDYLEFSLSFDELCDLFKNEIAHRDWKSALSSVAGIYLISDQASARLYVGSASGVEGIWGRWKEYSENAHGGNRRLMDLIVLDSERARSFRFSVLQTLPKSMTNKEVVQRERTFKTKFGRLATALNGN